MRLFVVLALSLAALAALAACDSASPVAPEGTVLTISVNPTRISATGEADVRVVARKPNGNAVNTGTLIRFTTSLGDIPSTVPTDGFGEARTKIRGTGVAGVASIRASTGSSEEVTVDVRIGLQAGAVSLQANPSSVPETGGDVTLLAVIRDDEGQPLENATVNFRSSTGSLASGGGILTTDSQGSVSDVLTVAASDIDALAGDSFPVDVEVGSSGGSLTAQTTVSVLRLPKADFSFSANNLNVVFQDTSTGNPTEWRWEFGDGNTSTSQNPSNAYPGPDTYTVTLRVSNSLGSSTTSKLVRVNQ